MFAINNGCSISTPVVTGFLIDSNVSFRPNAVTALLARWLDYKRREKPEHMDAHREWQTRDSQHLAGEVREIAIDQVDIRQVM